MKFGATFRDPNGLIKKFKGLHLAVNAPWEDSRVEISLEYIFYVVGTRNGYTITRPSFSGVAEAKVQELVDAVTKLFAELRVSVEGDSLPPQPPPPQPPLEPFLEDPEKRLPASLLSAQCAESNTPTLEPRTVAPKPLAPSAEIHRTLPASNVADVPCHMKPGTHWIGCATCPVAWSCSLTTARTMLRNALVLYTRSRVLLRGY